MRSESISMAIFWAMYQIHFLGDRGALNGSRYIHMPSQPSNQPGISYTEEALPRRAYIRLLT